MHLIEISPALRKKQFETLKCTGSLETFDSLSSPLLAAIKPNPFAAKNNNDDSNGSKNTAVDEDEKLSTEETFLESLRGTKVYWHNSLDDVPSGPTCIIAPSSTLYPCTSFGLSDVDGWRNFVAMNEENNSLEFVLSPGPTLSSSQLVKRRLRKAPSASSSSSDDKEGNYRVFRSFAEKYHPLGKK